MTTATTSPISLRAMVILLSLIVSFSLAAFSPPILLGDNARRPVLGSRGPPSLDLGKDDGYPVQIRHQGHSATIFVRMDEPILQALERQSLFSNSDREEEGGSSDSTTTARRASPSSLALSHIPHDCRRGNCLTCSSRVLSSEDGRHVLANVNNGLSPAVASELAGSGYVLTCCSYVTGPGLVLELDQNDEVWDMVYRRRICNNVDTKLLAMEAHARLLRRLDESNVGKWKRKMEETWEAK
jgi:ferredoxin